MILDDPDATRALGAALAAVAAAGDTILLSGPLGAGKTELARGFLAGRGHYGEVPSPSFSIVQPYEALDPPVWHVDLYRLEDPSEIAELGLDGHSEAILLVEWPEHAESDWWRDALHLSLEPLEGDARRLTAKVPPSWEGRWPPR